MHRTLKSSNPSLHLLFLHLTVDGKILHHPIGLGFKVDSGIFFSPLNYRSFGVMGISFIIKVRV